MIIKKMKTFLSHSIIETCMVAITLLSRSYSIIPSSLDCFTALAGVGGRQLQSGRRSTRFEGVTVVDPVS